jgi:hypothetical protein
MRETQTGIEEPKFLAAPQHDSLRRNVSARFE